MLVGAGVAVTLLLVLAAVAVAIGRFPPTKGPLAASPQG